MSQNVYCATLDTGQNGLKIRRNNWV